MYGELESNPGFTLFHYLRRYTFNNFEVGILKKPILLAFFFAVLLPASAQRGGENVYNFLRLTNAARVAALGGMNVSLADDDINLVFHNPALLSPAMSRNMNLNYVNYYAGVNYGYASYAFQNRLKGTFAGGIHYVNYGTFDRVDEFGNVNGTFRASEYAMNLVYSRSLIDSVLVIGVNVKPVFSVLEQYTSLGLVADLGIHYTNPTTHTMMGLVIKNAGLQLTSYTGDREVVPFEIQAGFSQGLEHAPFRFSVQFQHLERLDLTYESELENDLYFGGQEEVSRFDVIADQVMRHAIFGVELLFGESFHFDLGYNYKRRQELKMESWPGTVGFSWGFGFRVSKFHVSYGRATYHLAGGTNHFSITTNLSQFYTAR